MQFGIILEGYQFKPGQKEWNLIGVFSVNSGFAISKGLGFSWEDLSQANRTNVNGANFPLIASGEQNDGMIAVKRSWQRR